MHDQDPLESGAGAGEPLHPDQDNAPELHSFPSMARGFTSDDFRAAGRTIYATHPHGLAAVERLAGALDAHGPIDPTALPPFDRDVLANILATLSRS